MDKTEKKYLILGIVITAALGLIVLGAMLACVGAYFVFVLGIMPFGGGEVAVYANETAIAEARTWGADDTWGVYMYICGSDLESDDGAATADIYELLSVPTGDNVTVVMQTGGAEDWSHPDIDAECLQRFVYDKDGFRLEHSESGRNMGNPGALIDFLSFCEREYPADHTVFIIWNHGGGSVGGIAYDEQYYDDALTLGELDTALSFVYGTNPGVRPFDIIGFDACMMATVEIADIVRDYAEYMVASQEDEAIEGWDYDSILEFIASEAEMSAADVCVAVCDSYAEACKEAGSTGSMTLSVIDLKKVEALVEAYVDTGAELLFNMSEHADADNLLRKFIRNGKKAENYGTNSFFGGYSNMVDLEDLVRANEELIPASSSALYEALGDCLVYQVSGPLSSGASGLSCYHSLDRDATVYSDYVQAAFSLPHIYLYDYIINEAMSEEALAFVASVRDGEAVEVFADSRESMSHSSAISILENYPLYLNDDGYAELDIGTEAAEQIYGAYIRVAYVDPDTEALTLLGRDNDYIGDWDRGVFTDNFRGVWGAVDGHTVYMELIDVGEDYNLYSVPVLIGGEEYSLRVTYGYTDESFELLGAVRGLDNIELSLRGLRKLKPGDVVTALRYTVSSFSDERPALVHGDRFTVTDSTEFSEAELPDGSYLYVFELEDMYGNWVLTDEVSISLEDGEVWVD